MEDNRKQTGGVTGCAALFSGMDMVISAAVSLGFRIPVISRIGREGSGWMAGPYFAYLLLWGLTAWALAGFTARKTAVFAAKGRKIKGKRFFRKILITSVLAGAAAGICLLLFGKEAAGAAGRPMEKYAWESLALAAFFLPCLGAVRGRLTGLGARGWSSASLLLEQLFGGAASVLVTEAWIREGLKSELVYETEGYSEAFGAAGGILGLGVGAAAAVAVSAAALALYGKKKEKRPSGLSEPIPPSSAGAGIFCFAWGCSVLLDWGVMRGTEAWGIFGQCWILALLCACLASVPWSACLSGLESCRKNRKKLRELSGRAGRRAAAAGAAGGIALVILGGPGYDLLLSNRTGGFPGEAAVCAVSVFLMTAAASQAGFLFRLGKGIPAAAAAVAALAVHGAGLGMLVLAAGLGVWGAAAAHILSSACCLLLCRAGKSLLLRTGKQPERR